jgi:Nuclease A inhibitor-like protein
VTTAEIIDRLHQATTNLVWTSESDYPFEVVNWDRGTELKSTDLFTDLPTDTPIDTITLQEFFAPALQPEDWYGQEELATIDRYQKLVETIATNLSNIVVFLVGDIEITVYIVGQTSDRIPVGLKTQVVET